MRIRTVKPAFFHDEGLGELPPLTRLLFQGLWLCADGHGRLEDRPKRLKVEVLPYDDCSIHEMLESLQAAGFINRYVIDNIGYIAIPGFLRHQRISGKEAQERSVFPPPPTVGSNGEAVGKQLRSNGEAPVALERKGRERKGRERSTTTTTTSASAKSADVARPYRITSNIQLVVCGFKVRMGVSKDDRAWDKAHFTRFSKPAKTLLTQFAGDVEKCLACVDDIVDGFEKKGLSWTPETIVKHAAAWRGRMPVHA